jgi:hypothetical protein
MDVYTVDYLAEAYGLYNALALQRNIAVDFIDEDGLLDPAVLSRHKIIFVTGPNVPNASLAALVAWAHEGGTIVTTSSAATFDEIDQPSTILTGASGLSSFHNGRTPKGAHQLGPFGPAMKAGSVRTTPLPPGLQRCTNTSCAFTALGEAGSFVGSNGSTIASWLGSSGGGAATKWAPVDKGVHIHFAWLPGVTHTFSGRSASCDAVSTMLANLTSAAGVIPPVSVSSEWIEAPLLHGPAGSVVALLNWTDHGYDDGIDGGVDEATKTLHRRGAHHAREGGHAPSGDIVELNITLGFEPSSVTSVKHASGIQVTSLGKGIVNIRLPLAAVDFIMFRR